MIKSIAFDYGGVVEISLNDTTQDIIEYLKITKEDWKKKYSSFVDLCNNGEKTWEEVVLMTTKQFNINSTQEKEIQSILSNSEKNKKINFELLEIIKKLKDNGYKIALLSNYTSSLRQRIKNQGISNLFDVIIISGEVGSKKPDIKIFEALLEKLGNNGDELVFVDDSEKSFVNSEQLGFIPILFVNNFDFKKKISEICNI
jgi:putative hydrolase of the HAD superfamily